MNNFVLADCTTVDAALSQLKDGAVVKAGGVDLLERMKNGTIQPARLVNIRKISALRRNSRDRQRPGHRRAHHSGRDQRPPRDPGAISNPL